MHVCIAGLVLHGTRKERTVPAALGGTGKKVTITDDYWYSEDLKVYLVLKHNDPRTGEQVVGILDVDRKEPDAAMCRIPRDYKVVDETPVEPQEAALLSECHAEGVECSSLRERMVDDLLVGHELARGFYSSAPGQGHLSARGHELVADRIYDWLNSSR